MATVRMIRNPAASYGCPLKEGEAGELDQVLADQLIGLGLAVLLDPPKAIKAVPNPPEIVAAVPETATTKTGEAKEPATRRAQSAKP